MHMLSTMKIQAKRDEVLAALRTNREKHSAIVKEARVGYVEAAKKALHKKLKLLKEGKIVALMFELAPPQDHTRVYDTAIKMLEMHTEATIVLDSSQVRNLMMDEWDWKAHFLASNSAYSGTAREQLAGYEDTND